MRNPKLELAIRAVGGHVAVAYHLGRSVPAVYAWQKAGRVHDTRDAIAFRVLAAASGFEVTIEELAGYKEANGHGPKPKSVKVAKSTMPPRCSSDDVPESFAPPAVNLRTQMRGTRRA